MKNLVIALLLCSVSSLQMDHYPSEMYYPRDMIQVEQSHSHRHKSHRHKPVKKVHKHQQKSLAESRKIGSPLTIYEKNVK